MDITTVRANQIDALRAFAVGCVIFSHTIPETYALNEYPLYELESYGVFMFFVISAFLITSQLIKTKAIWRARGDSIAIPLTRFYAKRALRLLPAYYLALLGVALIDLGTIRQELPWHIFQLSNILFGIDQNAENVSPAGHFWSLSMEWQFYLGWPFLVLLLSERVLLFVTLAVAAFSILAWGDFIELPVIFDRTSIPISLDSLATGALLAIGVHRGWPIERWQWLAWPIGSVMLGGIALSIFGGMELGEKWEFITHEAMVLVFAAMVFTAARGAGGWWGKVLDWPRLQYIGLISYGIYLYHQFIIACFDGLALWLGFEMIPYGIIFTVVIFAMATAAAAFSWQFFEAPINRYRKRFAYRIDYPPRVRDTETATAHVE